MKIYTDFITEADEEEIGFHVDAALDGIRQNRRDGRNRILRFGWDYAKPDKWLKNPPEWVPSFPTGSGARDVFAIDCDSWTINEYLKDQRILPHIDSKAFGDVAILSLLGDATMQFVSASGQTKLFFLPRRSLAVISGELRHKWSHETLPLVADRRISIVYRLKL